MNIMNNITCDTEQQMLALRPIKNEKEARSSLLISMSPSLNLVIIRGALEGKDQKGQFKLLLQRIKWHLDAQQSINIYVKIARVDSQGISLLFALTKILNRQPKCADRVRVYWNTGYHQPMHAIAMDFGSLLDCPLKICDF